MSETSTEASPNVELPEGYADALIQNLAASPERLEAVEQAQHITMGEEEA